MEVKLQVSRRPLALSPLVALLIAGVACGVLVATHAEAQANYVATGNGGQVASSVDGITWTPVSGIPATAAPIWAVGHNGTHWVAAAANRVWVSPDGVSWTQYVSPMTSTTWGGIKHDGTRWVVSGGGGQGATSIDGVTWTSVSLPNTGNTLGMGLDDNGNWMSTGNTPNTVGTSPDGLTWTLGTSPGWATRGVIYHNGAWIIGGFGGNTARSTNGGATWVAGPNLGVVNDFAYDGIGTIVKVGGTTIHTSPDGINWTPRAHPITQPMYHVAFGNGLFVAVAYGGQLATSPDGITWTMRAYPFAGNILGIAARNNVVTARPDAYTFNEDQAEKAFNVTVNDAHARGEPFWISSFTVPTKGELNGPVHGVFRFKPFKDQNGPDWFSYTIVDANASEATATVQLTINPVNDAPSFTTPSMPIVVPPGQGTYVQPGWASAVAPGPSTAADETSEAITFQLAPVDDPSIFAALPSVVRTANAYSPPVVPPTSGTHGRLSFQVSGISGLAAACFVAKDSGGRASVTNSWGETVPGIDESEPHCVDIIVNSGPVAYFEPSADPAVPGQKVSFDPCPEAPIRCSQDSDGFLVDYQWEFGNGMRSGSMAPVHTFEAPGTYTVKLAVTDERSSVAVYSRVVTVAWPDAAPPQNEAIGTEGDPEPSTIAHAPWNQPPVADAGPSLSVAAGTLVVLDGSQSFDPDMDPLAFHWEQVPGGPEVELTASQAVASFTAPAGTEVLRFRLLVSDGTSETFDEVEVVLNPAPKAPADVTVLDEAETMLPEGGMASSSRGHTLLVVLAFLVFAGLFAALAMRRRR